jgi:hypothetical protein
MRDPENPDKWNGRQERAENHQRHRMPFDASELDNIPRTTDDDPPYQSWWVVNDDNR